MSYQVEKGKTGRELFAGLTFLGKQTRSTTSTVNYDFTALAGTKQAVVLMHLGDTLGVAGPGCSFPGLQ